MSVGLWRKKRIYDSTMMMMISYQPWNIFIKLFVTKYMRMQRYENATLVTSAVVLVKRLDETDEQRWHDDDVA